MTEMSEKMQAVQAAIDLSGATAALAVADASGLVLRRSFCPMRGRDSAKLAPWIQTELQAAGVSLEDVKYWTVGAGPGSFTGMRLAAALVQGWSFGRPEVHTRCVPTALAIAGAVAWPDRAANLSVLFDGRNREILLYDLVKDESGVVRHNSFTAILNREQAQEYFSGISTAYCARKCDEAAIAAIVPEAIAAKVQYVEELDVADLLRPEYGSFDGDLTKLVYIRPAVQPKE